MAILCESKELSDVKSCNTRYICNENIKKQETAERTTKFNRSDWSLKEKGEKYEEHFRTQTKATYNNKNGGDNSHMTKDEITDQFLSANSKRLDDLYSNLIIKSNQQSNETSAHIEDCEGESSARFFYVEMFIFKIVFLFLYLLLGSYFWNDSKQYSRYIFIVCIILFFRFILWYNSPKKKERKKCLRKSSECCNKKDKTICIFTNHNSTKGHLCACKKCRDIIGPVKLHITMGSHSLIRLLRKVHGLLCCSVTSCKIGFCTSCSDRRYRKMTKISVDLLNERRQAITCGSLFVLFELKRRYIAFYYLSLIYILIYKLLNNIFHIVQLDNQMRRTNQARSFFTMATMIHIAIQSESRKSPRKRKLKLKILIENLPHRKMKLLLRQPKTITLNDIDIAVKSPRKSCLMDFFPQNKPAEIIAFPLYGDMSIEMNRLASLSSYPRDNTPSLIKLARSGFYYDGKDRELNCFSCGAKYSHWSYASNPNEIHQRISPHCNYLKQSDTTLRSLAELPSVSLTSPNFQVDARAKQPSTDHTHYNGFEQDSVSNITNDASRMVITAAPYSALGKPSFDSGFSSSSYRSNSNASHVSRSLGPNSALATSASRDSGFNESNTNFPGLTGLDRKKDALVPTSRTQSASADNQHANMANSKMSNIPKEKYPEYIPVEKRRASYKNFPKNLHFLHPLDLSECGFFYSNFGDCVRCFHCGIGLRNWEPEDNPWVEHARWSKRCPYLLKKKGQEFIDTVLTVLGLQTDAEVERQARESGNERTSKNLPGSVVLGNDVRDPLQHPSAQYVIAEKIFGDIKEKIIKQTMNQLLQINEWDSVTNDMVVNFVLENREVMWSGENEPSPMDVTETSQNANAQAVSANASASGSDPEKIQKENEELKDLYTCKICLDEKVGITFVPCGHLVTCKNCSPKIKRCPLCRTFIRGTVKTTI